MINIICRYLLFVILSGLPNLLFAIALFSETVDKQQLSDTLEIAKDWFKKGVDFENEGKTEQSTKAIYEALRIATSIKNYALIAKSMNFLAINLSASGKRDEGISLSFKAFENFLLAGDTVRAANVKINIGMDYNNQGKYEEALKIELEALDLRLQCGDSTNLATYYQRIGEVYKGLGINNKWKSSLVTARHLSENPKYATFTTQMGILNDFGGIYKTESQYDEAIKVYLEMYVRSKAKDYLNGMATALINMSPVYRNLGKNEKALKCVKEALEIQVKRHNDYGILTVYNQLGEVYLSIGQTDQSKVNFLSGLKLSLVMDYVAEQKESYNGLYRVAKQQSNWKEALIYHEKWSQLEDSLQNIDLQEKVTELETKYQTEKKERQIELLNNENVLKNSQIKIQNLTIWGGGMFFLLVITFGIILIHQKRKQQIFRQNELEQKLLRSQMNPHFIFNSLGAIQHFMMKNDGRKASFYLSSFSSLMRSILKNSREELITLQEEKQTLENYLQLHKLRLGDKFTFNIKVSDNLDLDFTMLPPMLVQPFVENAVIHAIEKMEENGCITVSFGKENDQLVINVDDNGKGIENNPGVQNENHISYSLQIFKERVANLKKTFGTKIFYSIVNKGSELQQNTGTLVTVKLPLNCKQ